MKKSLALIDDLIEIETKRDNEYRAWALANNKGKQALGESMMLFHLKTLKELVVKEYQDFKII
jgi:hypothetical protein